MMESFPVQSQESQNHRQQNSNEISIQELLATIGELHVSNRRLLMRVEQLENHLQQSIRAQAQTNDNNNQIGPAIHSNIQPARGLNNRQDAIETEPKT